MNSQDLQLCYFGHKVRVLAERGELARLAEAALPVGHNSILPADDLLEVRVHAGPPPDQTKFPKPDAGAFLGWQAGFRMEDTGFSAALAEGAWASYRQHPRRVLDIWIADPATPQDLLANFALRPALSIALADFGLHTLHAAAVAQGDRALIIAGPSGSGKTTTALLLEEAALTLVADDTVVYEPASGLIRPLWQEPHIRPETFRIFPHIERRVRPRYDPTLAVRPTAIVLTAICPKGQVTLSELPKAEALVKLMGFGVRGPLPHQRKASLEAMVGLVRSCPTYSLHLAPEAQHIVALLKTLL
jgi:hypothetical protein